MKIAVLLVLDSNSCWYYSSFLVISGPEPNCLLIPRMLYTLLTHYWVCFMSPPCLWFTPCHTNYHLIHSTGYRGNWNRDCVVVSFNVWRSSLVGGSLPHIRDLVPVESVLSSSLHSWAWNIQKCPLLHDSIQDLQGSVTWYPTWLPHSAHARSLIWQQQLLVQ